MESNQKVSDEEWRGFRRLLNCGHYALVDVGFEGRVGQLTTCDMCPLTTHSPGRPGIPTAATRQIVGIDQAWASQHPDSWGPEHWYGGS